MTSPLLALNLGSSSLKFAVFDAAAPDLPRLHEGRREWLSGGHPPLAPLVREVIGEAEARSGGALIGIGHRVVHGGADFTGQVLVDDEVVARLQRLCPLAPLHQPLNLDGVVAASASRPDLPQVAVFDTAFHAAMPPVARRFGLPARFEKAGVRRYGFHGLSYAHVARRLAVLDPERAKGRVLAAHLGAGSSLCAMVGGRSIDTTMGFSALDGLVMATRCGALDPGAVLYLLQSEGLDAAALSDLLYRRSGLLGLSGISGDMRVLLASQKAEAREALALYVYRAVREGAGLIGAMGGLDAIVFTGGVGENAPQIRQGICDGLAWLGVRVDAGRNSEVGEHRIDAGDRVAVWVTPADEEAIIAEAACSLMKDGRRRRPTLNSSGRPPSPP